MLGYGVVHGLIVSMRLRTGTQISDVILDIQTAGFQTVKGFATIDNVALINVEVSSCCLIPSLARVL